MIRDPDDNRNKLPWWFEKLVIPILIPALLAAGGSYIAAHEAMARFDERLQAVENKVKKRPTDAELTATEDRANAYTDSQFAKIMIKLTEIASDTAATKDDVREIKQELR